jgi:superkiller protein 3
MAHYHLGLALHQQGKLEEAIACYRKAIELDPKYAPAHSYLGFALQAQGKLEEAIPCCRKAIELDPKLAPARNNLGIALNAQGKLEEAIACYRKAIELDPKSTQAHSNLAWLYATCSDLKMRDPARALQHAKKALELAPARADYNTLGVAQYRAGNFQEAVSALEKSMELRKGGNSFDWFFLAMARWQLGDKKDARQWYDRAVAWMEKNQPKNEELARFRTEAAELLGVK